MSEPYNLALMQAKTKWIGDVNKASAIIKENLEGQLLMMDMLPYGAAPLGEYPKVVLYPEFSLQGLPCTAWDGDSWLNWLRGVAVEIPSSVTDEFSKKSIEKDCYIQGCVWERDPKFGPDTFFESVFITDPKGKVVYKRSRAVLPPGWSTTTSDLYDEYVKKYGPDPVDAMFPVLETEYGVLGGIMCTEMSTPEIMRALSLNGAEVILHSTSEPHIHNSTAIQGHHFRDMERPVRATDNVVYLASCNIGKITSDAPIPEDRNRGHSEILDWQGNRLCMTEGPGVIISTAQIDIEAIRRVRAKKLFGFFRAEIFAPIYQREVWPVNRLTKDMDQAKELRREVGGKLEQRKVIHPPAR